jgi:hypothetical protein
LDIHAVMRTPANVDVDHPTEEAWRSRRAEDLLAAAAVRKISFDQLIPNATDVTASRAKIDLTPH